MTLADVLEPGGRTDADADGRAKRLGAAAARELRATHGTDDVSELVAREGVSVRRSDWDGVGGLRLFGTYADGVITVYDGQIPRLADRIGCSEAVATDLVVAHELGHHVVDAPATAERISWRRRLSSLVGSDPGRRTLEERAARWFALELVGDRLPAETRTRQG